jgi:hypothetical protein
MRFVIGEDDFVVVRRPAEASAATSRSAKYSHIDFTPPAGVREEAAKGLAWRKEHGRGGTAVGVARARDLSNGKKISPDTARRMKAFFDRHQVNKGKTGWSPGEKGFPSTARIAWALWGSDAGWAWSKKLVKQLAAAERAFCPGVSPPDNSCSPANKGTGEKSVSDAELYAEENLVHRGANYMGIKDPKMAGIINDELSSLVKDYGVKPNYIIVSPFLSDDIVAQASYRWSKKTVDGEDVWTRHDAEITLNKNFWESESQYRGQLESSLFVDQASHVGGARPRSAIVHEFGHLLDSPAHRDATQEIFDRRKGDLFLISSYAASSRAEMFAEAFTVYRRLGSLSNVGGADFSELEPYFTPTP